MNALSRRRLTESQTGEWLPGETGCRPSGTLSRVTASTSERAGKPMAVHIMVPLAGSSPGSGPSMTTDAHELRRVITSPVSAWQVALPSVRSMDLAGRYSERDKVSTRSSAPISPAPAQGRGAAVSESSRWHSAQIGRASCRERV